MSYSYQCSRCNDPGHPEYGPSHLFVLDDAQRRKLANAALKLSTQEQVSFLSMKSAANPVAFMPHNATSSARFMSLAYYGGGFPMVAKCEEDIDYYSPGWFLYPIGNTLGECRLWNHHNMIPANQDPPKTNMPRSKTGNIKPLNPRTKVGLSGVAGFVSGQVPSAGDSLPPLDIISSGPPNVGTSTSVLYGTSRSALYVPIENILTGSSTGQPYQLPEPYARPGVASTLSAIQDFKAGDYVFIDSFAGATLNEHGLMIVGFGPAIFLRDLSTPWPSNGTTFTKEYNDSILEIMNRITVSRSLWDDKGWIIDIDLTTPLAHYNASMYVATDVRVPYVVDWNVKNGSASDLIRQQPRPFYFTRYPLPNLGQFYFNHNYWLFIPAADSMRVRCDWFYAENVRGDQNAPFLINTDRSSSIIIEPNVTIDFPSTIGGWKPF